MKNVLLSFLFSSFCFAATAQITFTAADLPQIGGRIVLANDTTAQALSPGPAGANQTWDFSSLTADDTLSLDIINPAGTEYAALFPESNVALQQSDAIIYAQVTSDALLYLGISLDTFPEVGIPVAYRNMPAQIVYKLPTTSATNYTQDYSFTVTFDGSIISPDADSIRIVQQTKDTVMVDGYGTLITPAGTFQSLRLHSRSTDIMTISIKAFGFWQSLPPSTSRSEQFAWIAKETGGAAMSISYDADGDVTDIEWWLNPSTGVAPNADFTYLDQGGGQVQFNDVSFNNPTSWMWDFGDGATSAQEDPAHTYASEGTYTVCLTVSNENGSDQACQEVTVVISAAPAADFTFEDQGDGQFQFTDASTNDPTSWMWDFGDGNTSTDQNPDHTFAMGGTYTVCLTAGNDAGSNEICQTIEVVVPQAPVATFNYEDQGQGEFNFTDASTNNPASWMWDFGDGNTSTDQNPTHTYAASGTYTVCLTATNDAGSDQTCQEVTTVVVVAPVAEFTTEDLGNGQIQFTDASINDATSWMWDFGDDSTSTEQSPTHTYMANGTYNVCLTVTNIAGSNQICREITVVVTSTYALEREYGFKLYPNPASEGVQLELDLAGRQPLLIRFHDALGRQIYSAQLNGSRYIDTQSWPAGTYLFSVRSEAGELLGGGKLLKE